MSPPIRDSDSHTGQNIGEQLTSILQTWSLSEENLVATTKDNGSNVVLALSVLDWLRMPCFSHSLQLAVEATKGIKAVHSSLAQCRKLVGHFNHSIKSTYLLKQKQLDLKHEQRGLVKDVPTRWNSSYYMTKRVLDQQQPLCATLLELHRGDLMLSDSQFSTLETFCEVMEPLVQITEAIGAEKYVTISSVRPLLHKLLTICFNTDSETGLSKSMKQLMYDKLATRYDDAICPQYFIIFGSTLQVFVLSIQ